MALPGPVAALFDALALPAAARVDRRVAKALLAERGELSAADRRIVEAGVERLDWRATLKPGTAGVPAHADEARDYAQLLVMTAVLRPDAAPARLSPLMHRAVAHPLVLVLGNEEGAVLSVGAKRRHGREAGRAVLERIACSPPVRGGTDAAERAFLDSLALDRVPAPDLYALHLAWGDRADAYAAARVAGPFRLPATEAEAEARRAALAAYDAQARRAATLRRAARSERRLNASLDRAREAMQADAELARLRALLA